MLRKLWILAALVALSACTRDTRRTVPQVAVLRFENFSSDRSLDWMGRAFSEILSAGLQGSTARYAIQFRTMHSFDRILGPRPSVPGISTEAAGAQAAGANGIIYGEFSVIRGTLRATATEEDLTTHKMLRVVTAAGPADGGIFAVAGSLARQLGDARPFGTHSQPALRAYVDALETPGAAFQDLAQATMADPNFAGAYVFWLEAALSQRNAAEAQRVLGLARAHQDHFTPLDRASLDLGAAALRGDFPAQIAAMRTISQFDPANPNHHRALGEALMSVRDFEAAIVEFRRCLSVRPADIVALNSMGYAAAYSGDLPTAVRVLRGYEQLRPKEPNPLDSLGDVHFALGHFGEAEQFYLAADARSPQVLNGGEILKAAQARLMTGDVAGAGAIFERYIKGREAAHDPAAPFHAATWQWLTGARRAALDGMERLAADRSNPAARELAGRADAQAAVWLLMLGDRPGAASRVRRALSAITPATAGTIALVAYMVRLETVPEPAQSPFKEYARAYALLFDRQFAQAVPVLEEIYRRPTSELSDGLAVLLAWAYQETGQWQRAAPLLRLTPLPDARGVPIFAAMYFPRLFFLRAFVLDRQGRRDEAARNSEMFKKLSGPA